MGRRRDVTLAVVETVVEPRFRPGHKAAGHLVDHEIPIGFPRRIHNPAAKANQLSRKVPIGATRGLPIKPATDTKRRKQF